LAAAKLSVSSESLEVPDGQLIIDLRTAQRTDLDSRQIDLILDAARTWRERFRAEQALALATLVDRVILRSDGLDISMRLPLAGTEKHGARPSAVALNRLFPMQIKRRGVERRLIDSVSEAVPAVLLVAFDLGWHQRAARPISATDPLRRLSESSLAERRVQVPGVWKKTLT
jgi:hypothetical protein